MGAKALVDGIGLAEHAVGHVMAVVNPPPLVQHVLLLGRARVILLRRPIGGDVGTHIGQQVGAGTGFLDG